ncbi:LexA family protein [Peptostreptococcus equinus]|uniref:LexA family transcriptional regulator n=1 Tax=Peptostreptococcus equinus TaxID=3003601 RepID=A0ABY7JP33_9FIRM|nr:LexA family transcriptional regulator [Peptostreptococcus sp. CBA3647]WAW14646.1 LexA family transcriptional regulator [Peptostreptococcus sp. CBA3647]
MEEIYKRIQKAMDMNNISQADLVELTGINKASISHYVTGRFKPKQNNIYRISKALNVDVTWLMGADVDVAGNKIIRNNLSNSLYKYFPVSISAGSLENIEGISDYEEVPLSDKILGKYAGSKSIILLKVSGESMNKYIPNKSYIVVDTSKKRVSDIKSKDIVVFSQNGEYSVKRFINDESNRRFIFKPESYDDTYTDIIVNYDDSEDLKLIGKVVKYIVDVD